MDKKTKYELCIKLKEAGFVQRKWRYAFHFLVGKLLPSGETMIAPWEIAKNYLENSEVAETVYIPDMEEVMNDLQDDLVKVINHNDIDCTYEALSPKNSAKGGSYYEAVVNLWLIVNSPREDLIGETELLK